MVADFQDDVDLEDKPPGQPLLPMGPIPKENITLSSEEEAEDVAGHLKATVLAPQKCSEPETKQYVGGSLGRGPKERMGSPGGEAATGPLTSSSSRRSSTKASRPHRGTAPKATAPCCPGSTKPPAEGSRGHEEGKDEQAASSDSDPEGPIAAQMLSFVMDDPDFESDSDTQRRVVRTGRLVPTLPQSPEDKWWAGKGRTEMKV